MFSLGPGPLGRALRNQSYRRYVIGNVISQTGVWMQRITVGWVAWQLTHSGFWLGVVAFADVLPALLMSPLAGAVVDRVDVLRLARVTQALAIALSVTLGLIALAGLLRIEVLVALVTVMGVISAFYQPARLALLPQLVPREDLAAAIALNSVVFNVARFVGPAVAGPLIAGVGAGWSFLANAATYAVFFSALSMVTVSREERPRDVAKDLGSEIRDGFVYALRHPGIGPLLGQLLGCCALIRAAFELLPGFAGGVFGTAEIGLGMMAAATGIGAVASGLWLGRRDGLLGLTRVSLLSLLLTALFMLGFSLTRWFPLGLSFLAAGGVTIVLNAVSAQTLIQSAVDPAYRGRVLSLFGMIVRAGPSLGALLMGLASERIGLQRPLTIGCVLAIGLFAWIWPRRAQLEAALELHRAAVLERSESSAASTPSAP